MMLRGWIKQLSGNNQMQIQAGNYICLLALLLSLLMHAALSLQGTS